MPRGQLPHLQPTSVMLKLILIPAESKYLGTLQYKMLAGLFIRVMSRGKFKVELLKGLAGL